jgi:hypothetical protein
VFCRRRNSCRIPSPMWVVDPCRGLTGFGRQCAGRAGISLLDRFAASLILGDLDSPLI